MDLLQALSDGSVAAALRRSVWLYALVNAAHIFSIGLAVGSIVTLDLRLLGLFRAAPLRALGPPLARVAAFGIALAVLTGFLLFSVRPQTYVLNAVLLTKIGLVAAGIINAAILHSGGRWRALLRGETIPLSARLGALASLLIWPSAVLAGRWIGFSE